MASAAAQPPIGHVGDADAQALVLEASALGGDMRFCHTNFFGHSQLHVLMGLPTADGRHVLNAFAHCATLCHTFEEAETELHRLILGRWRLLVAAVFPLFVVVCRPDMPRENRLTEIQKAKEKYDKAWESRRVAEARVEAFSREVATGPRSELWSRPGAEAPDPAKTSKRKGRHLDKDGAHPADRFTEHIVGDRHDALPGFSAGIADLLGGTAPFPDPKGGEKNGAGNYVLLCVAHTLARARRFRGPL